VGENIVPMKSVFEGCVRIGSELVIVDEFFHLLDEEFT
jgi:hypothetical protein